MNPVYLFLFKIKIALAVQKRFWCYGAIGKNVEKQRFISQLNLRSIPTRL